MAEDKKSILFYADWITTFEDLKDVEAGRLVKHLLRYVNDKNPTAPDRLTKLLFEPIKNTLKRDLKKWEGIKEKRSEAGKASAEAKRIARENEQNSTKSTSVESVEQNSTKSTVSDSVNVSVSVINNIMEFFNFSEFKNADKQTQISTFVNIIIHQNLLQNFNTNFEAYKKIKSNNPAFTHSFKNFIGTAKERYLDGAWNDENWEEKLKAHSSTNKKFEVKGATDQSNNANLFK